MLSRAQQRKSLLVLFCIYGVYIIIGVRLFRIQVTDQARYKNLGTKQYTVTITDYPPRAPIYDRTSQYLALNSDGISAFMLPRVLKEEKKLTAWLARNAPQALQRLKKNHKKHFLFIKRLLTPAEYTTYTNAHIADINFLAEPQRVYPIDAVAPIIGITNTDTQGIEGIELLFNAQLAGTPSIHTVERDGRGGLFFKKNTQVMGHDGTPITLTIDADIQCMALHELQETVNEYRAESGGVVILDPATGELHALVSYAPGSSHPLKNSPVTDVNELGSAFKVFSALACLEEKVVTPDELIDCHNSKSSTINGVPVNTWKAHGIIPYADVVAFSNNIGIALVAERIGTKLYDHYKKLGFGSHSGIEFPGEQIGFINPPKKWSKQSIISLSYGYEISTNLVQLARALSVVACDGYLCRPTLIKSGPTPPGLLEKIPQKPRRLYRHETIEQIRSILIRTVTEGTGSCAKIEGYTIMGKTSSANMLVNGVYDKSHSIFTFMGIIEKNNYQRIIVTSVKDVQKTGVYASTVVGPLFERIAQQLLLHDNIL